MMIRKVEVYFENENDAESAKASLQSIKTTPVFIEEMSGETDGKVYVPFFYTNINSSGSMNNTGVIGTPASFSSDKKEGEVTHLLHCEVDEEDYNQAISILKVHNCFDLKS